MFRMTRKLLLTFANIYSSIVSTSMALLIYIGKVYPVRCDPGARGQHGLLMDLLPHLRDAFVRRYPVLVAIGCDASGWGVISKRWSRKHEQPHFRYPSSHPTTDMLGS